MWRCRATSERAATSETATDGDKARESSHRRGAGSGVELGGVTDAADG
ncbi:MAG TPA: hypothetical protein VF666_01275 [Pyrinomonadaceae bacterium]